MSSDGVLWKPSHACDRREVRRREIVKQALAARGFGPGPGDDGDRDHWHLTNKPEVITAILAAVDEIVAEETSTDGQQTLGTDAPGGRSR